MRRVTTFIIRAKMKVLVRARVTVVENTKKGGISRSKSTNSQHEQKTKDINDSRTGGVFSAYVARQVVLRLLVSRW